jgi:D-beta-D-heptose 7-phosphate kinase / D-beta-D-heptose 1-phosphate adenosyltransferase
MNVDSLLKLLAQFKGVRTLVLGDVMLDRFIYGSVERISPEAPIPVMTIERVADMPGGAGNVVRNLAALGARTVLIGVAGNDEWAEKIANRINRLSGAQSRLVVDSSRKTTVKTRYVAEGQQVLRADIETRTNVSTDTETQLLSAYESALPDADIVILSDYNKGVLTESVVAGTIAKARAAGKMIIVDPKSKSFEKYRGATVLTPNRQELQSASGSDCTSEFEIVSNALKYLHAGVCEMMVVTRGKEGLTVVNRDGSATHLRTTAREVFDVSGAGDTIAAAMALGLSAGGEIVEACTLANIAAGIVVGKRGTAVVTAGEIMVTLKPNYGMPDHQKLFSLENAVQLARDWHSQGLSLAFTNGCFDLLHPGHISLIDQARQSADRLIVGLNADTSVRRLKGPDRPIRGEIARATVLASLKSVDAVVIFSEDTPLALIDVLEPDVLVKGADYRLETVVGADLVLGRGGRVVLADILPGHSTTDTVRRVPTTREESFG